MRPSRRRPTGRYAALFAAIGAVTGFLATALAYLGAEAYRGRRSPAGRRPRRGQWVEGVPATMPQPATVPAPTVAPTAAPTVAPTAAPTVAPTVAPIAVAGAGAATAAGPRMPFRRRTALLALAFVGLGLTAAAGAWAYWGGITAAGGHGVATAATVNQAAAPSAAVQAGQAVAVSWNATPLSDGQPVSGYLVKRYDAATSAVQSTGAGCSGIITTLTCTEAGVPLGSWKYAITPLIGNNWQGAESAKGAQVNVGSSVLTLAKTVFGAPLPTTTTGTLTGFGAGEGLTYRLDAGTALTGSPATTTAGGAATITALTIPAGTTDGNHTVYAVGANGSLASFNIVVDTIAPTATAQLSPTANGAGWNKTTPVTVTLTGDDTTGSGVAQLRYTVDGTDPTSSGTVTTYTTPFPVASTSTVRYYASDGAGNPSTVNTQQVNIDVTAPVNALTLSNITGTAIKTGNTIHYRGASAGSFTVTNSLTDSTGSGPASSATAALGGTATGFTHTSSTVNTPASGPYVSAVFSWTPGTTSSPTETITGTDAAGNTTGTMLSLVNDSAGPTGGSVDATGLVGTGSRYSTSTTLSLALAKGTDTNGPATTGAQLLRATATLTSPGTTDGACGTFSGYTLITGGTDPATPKADTVTDQACYRYQYVVPDNLGNTTTYTSGDIKVDTTAPSAPTLSFAGIEDAHPVGTTIYYRPGSGGSFSATAAATDAASGIASYTFPALGTGWTSTPGATGLNTYTWSINPAAPGAKTVTATSNAGTNSATSSFTATADGSAPTGGSITVPDGYTTGLSVTMTFTGATGDVGAGIDPTSGRVMRTSAPLVNGVCGTMGGNIVNFTNPTSPFTDTTIANGNCYDYQYVMADNVGNSAVWLSPSIVKADYASAVNAAPGLLSHWRLGESSGTAMADSKGSNTGTYANGPTLGVAGAISGDTNTAVTYDGSNDYSQALSTTGLPVAAAPRSVEMWFKTTSTVRQTLFEYGSFGTGQEFGLYLRANNNDIVAWGYGNAGYDYTFSLASPVTDGNWHQVVNTYDGTTLAVYIDGVLLGSAVTPRNTVLDPDGSFGIGAALPLTGNSNSAGYFNGSLDEVSLYTTALGAQAVADHFNLARSTDTLGPAGGSVDAAGLVGTGGRYSTSTSLSIALNKGTDSAGVAPSGATLTRATATLSSAGTANATCGTFGSYAALTGGTDPSSPYADTVTAQACYRYQYTVTDGLGNVTTYTSGDIKVDTNAPATPTLAFSGFSNTYWSGSGGTVYYRSGASTGAFTATATSTDTNSGIASYAYPALGTNWTATPGATGVTTYSWSGAPAAPGAKAVTATNNAGLASGTTTFTPTADGSAPAGGSVSYLNGYATGTSAAVTFAAGTDGGSGLNATAGVLQRARATLTDGVCGSYSTFATIAANPTSPYTDTTVAGGYCYQYQYLAYDNVGNTATYTSASVTKLDYAAAVSATAGSVGHWRLGESTITNDTFTGTTGTVLTSRTGEVGATWSVWQNANSINAVLTDANRLRRNGTGGITYLSSAVPASPDYQVSADVHVKSLVGEDIAAVVGRTDTSVTGGSGTRYIARYSVALARWDLIRDMYPDPNLVMGTSAATLTAGQTYRLTLDMVGTRIRVLVNGAEIIAATDSAITGAGRAGIRLGGGTTGTAPTNTTGMHVDNFRVTPAVADSKGANEGTYLNDPTLGATGALTADANTSVTLNGSSQYMSIPDAAALDVGDVFTLEAWVKRADSGTLMQTIAHKSGAFHIGFLNNQFVFYRDNSTLISTATTTPTDTTTFHHYVVTKNGNAVKLYIDGTDVTGTLANATIANSANPLSIGARYVASASEFLNGTIDEVSLYNTAISGTTVTDHYDLGRGDATGPTGGSVDATGLTGTGGRYATTTAVNLAFTPGTDARSGLAYSGAQLRRSTATLTSAGTANGTCGSYNTSVQVGSDDPTSPYADTVPAGQACYRYEYVVSDGAGNTTTYLSGDVKVDTTAPSAPTLGFSALSNAYASGSTVYYRPAATSGGFTVTAAATDTNSGIASYAMPTLGTGWSAPSGSTGVQAYSWSSANPSAPVGAQNATATNNAGLTATAGFTATPDATAPATGTISYTDGYYASASVAVTFAAGGSDTGSGVNPTGGLLQRRSATLTNGTCGSFGGFATVTGGTNPSSPFPDTTVVSGNCYQYQYVTTDRVGNTSAAIGPNTAKYVTYAGAVSTTTGLVSQWRLGESTKASDTFTDTTGALLSAHDGEVGTTTWTAVNSTRTAQISATDTVRVTSSGGNAAYYASAIPASADYLVEADVILKGGAGTDDHLAGVVGRLDTTGTNAGTFYTARYARATGNWELRKAVNGTGVVALASATCHDFAQTLTVGQSYRLGLDMKGSTIRMIVDGVVRCTGTDSSITAAGRAGVRFTSNTAPGDATGVHLDNFDVNHPVVDSYFTNHGDYFYGPTLGVTGAISGDANTAATFNGSNEYATVAREISDDFSIEFWFKSATVPAGFSGGAWVSGRALVDASTNGQSLDFGVSLRTGGGIMAGTGDANATPGDVTVHSTSSGYDDGSWHHVVFTRTKSTGALALYVDGAAQGTGIGDAGSTLSHSSIIAFGRRAADGAQSFPGSLDEIAVYNTAIAAGAVTEHYNLGSPDITGPTGGSVDATGLVGSGSRYSTSTNLSIALNKGTDARSGLAASGAELRRSTATLTSAGSADGTCGAYNTSVQVGADDPTSPFADTVPAGPACYRYEYVVPDGRGNTTTYLSGDIKLDPTAPAAPTFVFSAMTNAYWSGSGSNVYYRRGASSGSFTATATTIDTQSGIASYTMPNLGTGWTTPSGTNGVQAYAWSSANPAAPAGTQNATATNNATLTSAAGGFTLTADDTAPTAGSITYTDGTYSTASVSISFTSGTDAGAGVNTAGRVLQRAAAPLSGSTCGSYGSYATVTGGTNPTSPFTDTTIVSGSCYQYRYVTADHVGNEQPNTSTNTVKYGSNYATTVLATSGLTGYYRLGEASGTTMTDIAPTPNNGTYSGVTLGATSSLLGDANTAATFNGTSSYATVSRQISDDFSIEFRFKSTQNPGTGARWWDGVGLVDADAVGTLNDFGVTLHGGGKIAAGTGTSGGSDATIITSTSGYNDGQWHHVVFTRVRSSGAMRLYVDGALRASGTGGTNSLTSSPNVVVGRLAGGGAGDYVAGTIDEVSLYTVTMDADTVLDHYNEAATYLPATSTWNFEETSGTNVDDSSGYAPENDGTASWSTGWDATGHTGRAINFDSSMSHYVAGTNQPIDTGEPFTVSAWVNLSSTGTTVKTVFSQGPQSGDGTTFSNVLLKYGSNGKWTAMLKSNTGSHTQVESVASGTTGWVRLTVVFDGANLKLYAGAAAAVSAAHTAQTTGVSTNPLQLSRTWWAGGWADPFNGRVDEVRTYRRALTAAEVAAL